MARIFLDIGPGINADDTSVTVGASAWGDGGLVRSYNKRMQPIGGWERVIAENLSGVCRTAINWTDSIGALIAAFGTHTSLEIYRGGELFDITPVGLAPGAEHGTGTSGYSTGGYSTGGYSEPSAVEYFARTWSLDTYGESLMAAPRGGTIYWWQNDTAVPAAALTNAPAQVTAMLVTEQRQVMAIGCNEEVSGDFNPLCVRWTDIENPTDWTTTPTNNAGEEILKGGGRLVGGEIVGPNILLWTDNALYRAIFIGDPSQTFRFELVASRCGLMGPNASVVVDQTAYWVTPDGQFYAGGLSGAEPIPCTVSTDFVANLAPSQMDKIVASSCRRFSEIRFDYPDQRDGLENSRYVAVNTRDGTWGRGQMARSAYVDAGPSPSPIGVAPTGEIYFHERGASADGGPIEWFLESAGQYISGEKRCMRLDDVEPDFADQVGPVRMTVYDREYPQGPEEEIAVIDFAPGDDFHDFRAEGRILRVRLEGNGVPSFARVGRLSFEAKETGRR